MYLGCAFSVYGSLVFAITDIVLARDPFGVRSVRGPSLPATTRSGSSASRSGDGPTRAGSIKHWVDLWERRPPGSLDALGRAAAGSLWLDSDLYYERHRLSVAAKRAPLGAGGAGA
ncbi:hypothetical protein LZ31DRAFT_170858 [Colletotrichum somersetense]|nr:hypothetical protein LZ31DRAFT_170858 [Colletotrichum somersetense]